jgi:HNH endonuclease
VDHFLPWARYPENGIENLVVTDPRCNNDKRDFLAAAEHVERWRGTRFGGAVLNSPTLPSAPTGNPSATALRCRPVHLPENAERAEALAALARLRQRGQESARGRSSCYGGRPMKWFYDDGYDYGNGLPGEPREIHGFVLRKAAEIHDHLAESGTVGEGHFHHPVAVNEGELHEVHAGSRRAAPRSVGGRLKGGALRSGSTNWRAWARHTPHSRFPAEANGRSRSSSAR